jgi:S-DNA-T family DNA segregation ATPase FtsK/SpoIIIE
MLVPMLAGMGAMALMFSSSGSSSRMWMGGGLFAASVLGMVAGFFAGGGGKRAELNSQRRDYLRHLGQARRRVRRSAEAQRAAMLWRHPDPAALSSIVAAGRIWERRPDDPDFTQIRLASGAQKAAIGLIVAESKPVEDLEPLTAIALRRFLRAHAKVDDLPIALAVKAFSRVLIRGDRVRALNLARAVLCQLATFHAPGELRLAAVVAENRRAEWEWLKWLPHVQHGTRSDAAGPLRLVFESLMELEEAVRDDLSNRVGAGGVVIPHVVVLFDGGDAPASALLRRSAVPGVTLLDISGVLARGAGRAINLEIAADGQLSRTDGETSAVLGSADALDQAAAEAVARQLAPWRLAVKAQANAAPVSTDFASLLNLGDLEAFDLRTHWKPREDRERLKIPLGLAPDGSKVDIDFKESAHQGMGPHGILIGGTGSGKSELLRTIVAALAVTHSSEDLNFVLVDFKGGATFASLDVLPHTSAIITNLSDELPLVDRMEEALRGELVRRQELLRKEGNYVSRYDYAKDRAAGKPLPPLPSLLIICDEFSELLTAKPSFADLFLQIGRVGRSLGVHILLASQRLEEGKLRGLDSLLSYRIGLRTDAATDSRAVIGVSDAAELPKGGGHGYLKPDPSTLLRFRGAYISGPYRRKIIGDAAGAVAEAGRQVVPFTTSPVTEAEPQVVAAPVPAAVPHPDADEDGSRQATVLDLIVERLKGQGTPAHKVWLDPLDLSPTLDQLFSSGAVMERPGRGLSTSDVATLRTPIGVVDKPADQRRDPLELDLDGAGGNILVIGGTRSGKSTLLRTFVTSMALTHTPAEVQFFCLDFGGGSLRGLDDLPHVCGVANRREIEAVRRTVSEVVAILDEREARFAELGTDIAEWRRKRATGEVTDDPFGDVFLVVDNWTTVREEFESLEPIITGLATRGLNFGIHVVVTAPRYVDVRSNLRDALRTRLELRLGDPSDSELDRKAAVNVPAGRPGRGLASLDGRSYHYLIALPRIDGRNDPDSVSEGTAALVGRSRTAWQGPPVRRVRLLPQVLTAAELNEQTPPDKAENVLIGLNESKLAPVRLDFARDPHMIIFGDTECGKTNLLRHIARQITAENEQNLDLSNLRSPRQSRIIIVDFKRSLLEIADGPMVFKYVTSAGDLTDTVKELRTVLTQRMPGRDVTPAQLRERSWWKGKALYLMIDDYDLVAGAGSSPLAPLSDMLSQGADIGFHVVLARRASGASRAVHESVIAQMRNIETPVLLMSGPADEGPLVGKLRPGPLPAGRGHLVRRDGTQTIQTAWSAA